MERKNNPASLNTNIMAATSTVGTPLLAPIVLGYKPRFMFVLG
jgi:hypothetical protein